MPDSEFVRRAAIADDALEAVIPDDVRATIDDVVNEVYAELGESPEAIRGAAQAAGALLRVHTIGINAESTGPSRADLLTIALAYRIIRHPLAVEVLTR